MATPETTTTAVITGASRGLGAGLAQAFADRGIQLGLCARGQAALPDGPAVISEQLDVREADRVDAFARRIADHFGPIGLWINNAGVLEPIAATRDVEPEAFRRNLEINVLGVFNGSRSYVRHLHRAGARGVLVNLSSGAAERGYAGWSAYSAAKAAVDRLTECISREESARGLRAYAVSPGLIDTQMQEQIRSCTPERFPEVGKFLAAKRDGAFNSPAFVAAQLLELVRDPALAGGDFRYRLPAER